MRKLLLLSIYFFVYSSQAVAAISKEDFFFVLHTVKDEYQSYASQFDQQLHFNMPDISSEFWWNLEVPHAYYTGYFDEEQILHHQIFISGGVARLPNATMEGVALILCHELGHPYGGAPLRYDDDGVKISLEGQADYYSTAQCLRKILPLIPTRQSAPPDPYGACQDDICRRIFVAIETQRDYFAANAENPQQTNYYTPSTEVVDSINYEPFFYPSAQCRLDTLVAGALQRPRPACWYKEP